VVTQIKGLASKCNYDCFVHSKNFATNKISSELNSVFSEVVKIVNYVKANALNSLFFAYNAIEWQLIIRSSYYMLKYVGYQGGKSYQELRNKLVEFLQSKKPNWTQLFFVVN
jgi:ABC-type uncharacterized transport system ATPase subunit